MSRSSRALAAPTSGPIETMQDLKGAWLTSLTGFSEGDPINWVNEVRRFRPDRRRTSAIAMTPSNTYRFCILVPARCQALPSSPPPRVT